MIVLSAPPAIIAPRPVLAYRFFVDNEDCGSCLPADYRQMPRQRRALIDPAEVRSWLPEPYRRLSRDLLLSVLGANLPGLPGVIMAGAVRAAWLYTDSEVFSVPGDWNPLDNIVHAVGAGGNGLAGQISALEPGYGYGGGGGGGAAYANKQNIPGVYGQVYQASPATSGHNDTSFNGTDYLLAKGGGNAPALSGGTAAGGSAGNKASCIGDFAASGSNGFSGEGGPLSSSYGGGGGSAGGPHGDALSSNADAGYGGVQGSTPDWNIPDTSGSASGEFATGAGWLAPNPTDLANAGSGGGAYNGTFTQGYDGGLYGGGASGGPYGGSNSAAGNPAPGCVLVVNNVSL